ncbi:restriction endonuclease subunit S [Paenibacillus ginsengarvi]|uniref:Type I restriction modification DNA specificity domain-containing protein n=1 Tax=Paenibacillus ginsengarvi TaxID=400777 RepID=A0A3B0BUK0_9BACL|nr:restriction endonuclease subunit S [Paenibacillus ginsengarvi]RKN77085.1 hypothetical protein D7M11_23980 [Paenibacillus ginsengarvi]
MAKSKKQNLSANELLEQALVPEDEQPYEVPENWLWTRLGTLSDYIQRGKSPKYSENQKFPVISQKCIQWDGFDSSVVKFINPESINTYGEERFIQVGDILWNSTGTGTIGRLNIYNDELSGYDKVVADSHVTVVRISKVNNKYAYFYLCSPRVQDGIEDRATGTTNQIELNTSTVINMLVPLPPLAEQQRIVDCIESLFIKLDQAKELAQNALDSFETRKAAILHKAFTGELTAKWREGHSLSMDSWKTMPLSKLAYIQTGLAKGKQINSVTTTMPYLRVANVQDGYLDLSEIKLITVEKDKIERYRLKEGDVLFTEGGDYDKLGRGTVWRAEIENCLHQNHVFAVRPEPTVLNSFYLAYLASSRYGKSYFLSCSKQTTNLASINSTQLKAFPVFCPSIIEQQEIVRILDTLIEKEQSAKYKLELLLDQIDQMKKSILARAFRGELGTNDPSEESALELLKEVVLPQ